MTDLEVYRPAAELAVAHDIDSWTKVAAQVIKLSEEIYDTPFVPDGLRGSVPATAAAILAGRELGLGPMTSLANVHVIKGKPGLSAALMRALILAQGHRIETLDISDSRCVIRGRRRDESVWEEVSFTADQARRAHIDLGGYPQDKLYARATSHLARRKFADVIAGMPYSAEELEDGPGDEPVTDTPAPAAQPAQRTARRGRSAPSSPPPAAAPTPPAPAGGALPPLPGEEEITAPVSRDTAVAAQPAHADATGPGAAEPDPVQATTGQVGMMQGHFKRLGFEEEDREQRLATAATIAGMPEGVVLGSLKLLTQDQAKAVIDTLSRCKDRERLIAVLAAGEQDG
jgi:hypothetical protein